MTPLRGIGMVMYVTLFMYLVLVEYICFTAAAALPIDPQHAAVSM